MEFAVRAMRTLNFRTLCQEYGISAKTGYKWKERFRRKGLAGMEEESRRPRSHSEQLPEEEVCEIVRLKLAHMSWGPRKIRELYLRRHGEVASESTFKRVLERAGLTQKRRRRRWIYGGRLLTTNGRTKPLACVAPGNSTSLRRGNMKERPMMWNIPRCALAE